WRPELAQGLARSFRLVTVDNRGTGFSDKRDEPTSIAQMADDAVAGVYARGLERAHRVGISVGGGVAPGRALRPRRRVIGLVLGCTNCGAPISKVASQQILALLIPPAGVDPREAARHGWQAVHTPEFIESNRDFLESMLDRTLANPTPLFTRMRQS